MLKVISISNYKGFYKPETINFSIPDNEKPGSGLTLIVGPNNTGKTTVIEALLLNNTTKKFKVTERHNDNPVIKIENSSGQITEYTNINNGSAIHMTGKEHNIKFELIPSRRFWSHQFNGEWEFNTLINESSNSDVRNSNPFNLGPMLKKILTTEVLKEKFDSSIKEIIPHFTDWTMDTNEANQDFIKYKTIDGWHQANLLGDGIISLFRIVAHLTHDEKSTFIIDEPELSLHPSAQKRLSAVLSKLSKNKQIIVCTHSPYFVDWSDFINGAKIIRLNKNHEKCVVNELNNTKDYSKFISQNFNEFEKPQLLDTSAKEILFSDKILFLEGQEDVGILKKWIIKEKKQVSFEIFGYGVGGETNMTLFLELAKDLGLEKVAALYDSNSISFITNEKTYKQQFLLKKLPTEDIREKVNHCKDIKCPYGKNRNGTFASNGDIKPEFKEKFEILFDEISNYFNSSKTPQ
ncbi:hypothetical protein COU49_00155 [Candidatus Nomurabacteria bacterium CG10_big_fil_rev_8_21_14_0_10_35_16]|uniref:Uncharacterized protein n=1 Tax=Candidatus Nomurabacteria bacterium CG10_big_fil_rev_8_21_14_0_10_35_16 TaxID=1974731 RepID=A0A2H0TEB0_9BACT|nr:MAG: hypothetical protein COU49_00155 [Candidatus Nomurabacteria bacterium CG10_big_fil_rev_8_21_14_0_10_35_16]